MDWFVSHIDDLLAVIGGVYTAARIIVTLTPTPRDNAVLDQLNGKLAIVLRVVLGLAKIAGLDARAGVRLEIPADPPPDLPDRPDGPRAELGSAASARAKAEKINAAARARNP